jgi:hypothetical protein
MGNNFNFIQSLKFSSLDFFFIEVKPERRKITNIGELTEMTPFGKFNVKFFYLLIVVENFKNSAIPGRFGHTSCQQGVEIKFKLQIEWSFGAEQTFAGLSLVLAIYNFRWNKKHEKQQQQQQFPGHTGKCYNGFKELTIFAN